MIMSIILGAVVAAIMFGAQEIFRPGKKLDRENIATFVAPMTVGMTVGLANYFAPRTNDTLFLVILLIAMIAVFGYLAYWWNQDGASWKEMIPFLMLLPMCYFTTKAITIRLAELCNINFVSLLVNSLPAILMLCSFGYYVYTLYKFRQLYDGTSRAGLISKIALAFCAIVVLFSVVSAATRATGSLLSKSPSSIKASADEVSNEVLDEESTTAVVAVENTGAVEANWSAHYYNTELQNDESRDNDFNYGPNPFIKGNTDSDYYSEDFASRRDVDPALLSATCVALDCTLGTDYIGEILYEGYDEKWNVLEKADAATRILAKDKSLFDKVNNSVNELMAKGSREVKKLTNINDQLFMNPATVDGIPGIVYYESSFDEGYCLVYTFQIKSGSNTKATIKFHIKCGYQWCNAKEKIGVAPKKQPKATTTKKSTSKKKVTKKSTSKKKTTKKSSNKGSKKVKKTKKTKKKTYTRPDKPKYNKNPDKAPKKNTEPNDDKGPGPNTNSGGNKSTKEQKENSNNKSSYQEYKEDIQKKKEVNETQKKSGDSNTPSTKPKSSSTNVDNNGDKGTGSGGADAPTPKKEKAKEASSGNEINNKAGEAWGGPSD